MKADPLQKIADTKMQFSDSDRSSCDSYWYCPRCDQTASEEEGKDAIIHKTDCPVIVARKAIHERTK